MKPMKQFMVIITLGFLLAGITRAQFQMEEINRGLVAVEIDAGIYIGWRLLGTDPDTVTFNVYRGDTKLNTEPVKESTNFIDSSGTNSDTYHVIPVIGGVEQTPSNTAGVWHQNYLTIPLDVPPSDTTIGFTCTDGTGTKDYPDGQIYTYSPNDASVGDLDGDGQYEIILKWDPSNSHDNAHCGCTGNVILDAYELDGTLLWRIDLGVNVRAGAHYDPFMVYDLNGDGKAEVVCRTAEGTKDATGEYLSSGPAENADHEADHRNNAGRILSGPEYLTVFNGSDGTEMVTTDLEPARGYVGDWGDTYGNRVDRFLAAVLYLGSDNPSFIWARGIYEKIEIAAWDLINGELVKRWHFKSTEGYSNWEGMGSHNLSVADVDGDNKDEIIYGNCAIDDNGTGLWTLRSAIGKQTGDAMHLADIVPERPGLEKWGCHEGGGPGSSLVDAHTGEVLWLTADGDVGRSTAGDLVEDYFGMECWGGTDGLRSANNEYVGPNPSSTNHVVWWDGDLGRELLDASGSDPNYTPYIREYRSSYLLTANGCYTNNSTKRNPCLQADIFGDWREEVIFRTSDNSNLRIYTTTDLTEYRIKTLMHDPVYRLGVAWQNDSYNQPPHTSFYLGFGMFTPDSLLPPSKPHNVRAVAWDDTVQIDWDKNLDWDLAGYRLYRGKSEDSLSLLNDMGTATTYLDTDVINDSIYYYALLAYDNDNNESVFSDTVWARPSNRPDTPSGISYRYDANSIMLIWDSQDYEHISGIKIYRANTIAMIFELITTLDKSVQTYTNGSLTTGHTYYYQISVTDTNDIESFPTDVLTITPGSSFTFQSEDASHSGSYWLDDNHPGFHGTAFFNFDASNSTVEFTNMPGFGGGERGLVFRYALGNTDRTGNLIVNGTTHNLTMQGTGDWANWVYDSVGVTLNGGYDNTITFSASGNDFGNLDEIIIIPEAISAIASKDNRNNMPTEFQLYQNYPNPFNPSTTIRYDLPQNSHVKLTIYNILGEEVQTLINKEIPAGKHSFTVELKNRSSGIYFYTIKAGYFYQTKKMVLIR